MKKTLALAAVVVAVLAPSGTAYAGETGNGKAYGNCGHSSAGGDHDRLAGGAGKGNGGHQGETCKPGSSQPVIGDGTTPGYA